MQQLIQQWVVGGAVRDVLLHLTPKDIDYCWTGATVDDMLFRGFSPVGASFPVFLDQNGNEHALARHERKVAAGYNGFEVAFDPSITIEEDLFRRDLTMNALAVKFEDWDEFVRTGDRRFVVDVMTGIDDLEFGQLRHTSPAFAEDPVRVLRTARFAARYGFDVHPATVHLMKYVVPELFNVPQERIWAEFQKGLMEAHPVKMMTVLADCGALDHNGPLEPYRNFNFNGLERTHSDTDLTVRFTLVSENFKTDDYSRCRVPSDCERLSRSYHPARRALPAYMHLTSAARLSMLESVHALNDTWLISKVLETWECDGGGGYSRFEDVKFNIMRDLAALKTVDCAAIAASCNSGKDIKQAIFNARVNALETYYERRT